MKSSSAAPLHSSAPDPSPCAATMPASDPSPRAAASLHLSAFGPSPHAATMPAPGPSLRAAAMPATGPSLRAAPAFELRSLARAAIVLGLLSLGAGARAATLSVSPQNAQPGDILTLTVSPAKGERLAAIGMSAFDTKQVKFFSRPDGSVRAFVGYPFDRAGGTFPLAARVQTDTGEAVVRATFTGRTRAYPTQHITMRDAKTASKMNQKGALRAEKTFVQSKMASSYGAPLWSGNWVVPCRGAATSAYGRRRYVNGKWWGQHNGADVKAGSGTPVHAANSGRVVMSAYLPALRGNCIIVDHGCNIFSVYMHLSKREAVEGQAVQKGQEIGKVGATGFVTGPHLHWEVRVGQEPVDPNHVVARGVSF